MEPFAQAREGPETATFAFVDLKFEPSLPRNISDEFGIELEQKIFVLTGVQNLHSLHCSGRVRRMVHRTAILFCEPAEKFPNWLLQGGILRDRQR